MKKQMRRLLCAVLIFSLFTACFTFPSQAADAYRAETTRESALVFLEDLLGKIVDTFDRLIFFFTSLKREDGSAAVKAGAMSFVAKGFESKDKDVFQITGGFSMKIFGGNRPFHRVTLRYTSTEPLKLTVTGKEGDNNVTNAFFLEAAQDGVFASPDGRP